MRNKSILNSLRYEMSDFMVKDNLSEFYSKIQRI